MNGLPERRIDVQFDDNRLLPMLYGEHDRHLARIESLLGVSLISRGNTLTISGRVTDEAPGGLTVILSGSRAVGGLSAIVLANGTWSVSTSIPAGSHGNVTATVTDWYGLSGAGYGSY